MSLSADYVRQRLDYDPSTGVLSWRPVAGRGKWNTKHAGKPAGHQSRLAYLQIRLDGVLYAAHRLAWLHFHGEWPGMEIDHANRLAGDNRIANLRLATRAQNQSNTLRPSKTGFKGVDVLGPGRFRARSKLNNRIVHLGVFRSIEDAAEAARAGAAAIYGQFAVERA